ncbi:hypothetical protein BYT27DRAFT_7191523 [Phlegmacium glaucopus]|nr:hypothetical protein BYT27DRAFT_7191523 [Phlegmacium glaucopus]
MSSATSSRSSSPEPKEKKNIKRKRKEVTEEEVVDDNAQASDTPEEPVLSHAERRRRKKEQKLAAKLEEEEGSTTKKRKLGDGSAKAVVPIKRQNSVWVGNMSFKTTQENLRMFFADVGEITRINMPTKPATGPGLKPENRGFAYVDFATPEAKSLAIALSESPLVGRKLLIKDGDSFAGRPAAVAGVTTFNDPAVAHQTHSKTAQKILGVQKQSPSPTLFFGNLGFQTTEASIRELLNAHRLTKQQSKDAPGNKPNDVWIRKVRMGTFEDSGLCKGFAFVDFMTIEHATSALINPKNHQLNGRSLVVEYGSPDAVRRGAPKGKSSGGAIAMDRRNRRPTGPRHDSRSDRSFTKPEEASETADANEVPAADSDLMNHTSDAKERTSSKNSIRHKGPKSRPKPGAALALAKRESAAILPSQGHKITF